MPDKPEAIEQGLGELARVRRRPQQRELRQRHADHVLACRQVDHAIFHGRIEALGHRAIERVDLVDEEDIPLPQRGEQ